MRKTAEGNPGEGPWKSFAEKVPVCGFVFPSQWRTPLTEGQRAGRRAGQTGAKAIAEARPRWRAPRPDTIPDQSTMAGTR